MDAQASAWKCGCGDGRVNLEMSTFATQVSAELGVSLDMVAPVGASGAWVQAPYMSQRGLKEIKKEITSLDYNPVKLFSA